MTVRVRVGIRNPPEAEAEVVLGLPIITITLTDICYFVNEYTSEKGPSTGKD